MRKTFLVAAVAMTGACLLAIGASPTKAAILTVGAGLGPPYGGGTCADVRDANLAPGTPVQAFQCLGGPNQQFEIYGGTIYTLGGQMCLDVRGGGTAPGTPVDSYTCNGTPAQQWDNFYGLLVYVHGNLCLDAGNMENSTQLVVNTCNFNSTSQGWQSNSQQWQIKDAVLTVGAGLGPPYGGSTCADVRSANLTPGTAAQAFNCLAGPNQQFEIYSSPSGGPIYTLGGQRCLDVWHSGTAPGTPVDSYTCNGTAAQQWYFYNSTLGGIRIYYPNGILCLDAGNMENATQLVVNTCNGSNSQQWMIK
jgi:Ricin-type beta-trefoil lectin domain